MFVYVCKCVSNLSLFGLCLCVFVSVNFNNLRANGLGQWILSNAYLVALCAIVESAGCISSHICPIAIPISVLQIQILFASRVICIVVVAAAAAAAVDGRFS